jgi:hypothetical protein
MTNPIVKTDRIVEAEAKVQEEVQINEIVKSLQELVGSPNEYHTSIVTLTGVARFIIYFAFPGVSRSNDNYRKLQKLFNGLHPELSTVPTVVINYTFLEGANPPTFVYLEVETPSLKSTDRLTLETLKDVGKGICKMLDELGFTKVNHSQRSVYTAHLRKALSLPDSPDNTESLVTLVTTEYSYNQPETVSSACEGTNLSW